MRHSNLNARWPIITKEERKQMEAVVVNEMDKQQWASVVYLHLWRSEGLICTQ